MIEQDHQHLSIRQQCEMLGVPRSMVYYEPHRSHKEDLAIMRLMDELYLKDPTMGTRRMMFVLGRDCRITIGRKRARRLMRTMGLEPIYPRKSLSIPGSPVYRYPYLLRGLEIERADQVWCSDITYIPMSKGFLYLVVVMDWFSRKVLSWRLSNTLDASFCLRALEHAIQTTGSRPDIFNTDQGCQYTSAEWTGRLKELGISISMNGRARWLDNWVVERFWRSLKYEDIYLKDYQNAIDLEMGLLAYFDRYNLWRPHSSLNNQTPGEVYATSRRELAAA